MKTRAFFIVILIAHLAVVQFAQQSGKPAPAGLPQTQPDQDDVVRITTNLVQVDAIVTDKSGKAVTDLKPEEIQILEDNRPQKVSNFSYVVADTTTAAHPVKSAPVDKNAPPIPTSRLKREDVRRTIAVVVDDLGLTFESVFFVRQALKKFVDEQMQPGDLVAILRSSSGMGALQQFTSDKQQLHAAIESVRWTSLSRGGVGTFAPYQPIPDLSLSVGGGGSSMSASNDDWMIGEDVDQLREDQFAVGTLGALSYLIKGLKELPGRKSVLLVSDGLTAFNTDDPGRSNRVVRTMASLTEQANRAAVVIYTMSARGLQIPGFTAADSFGGRPDQAAQVIRQRSQQLFDSDSGLNSLAEETGGVSIKNNNDISAGIKRILDDQKGYYLIGYRPDQSTFDPRTGRRTFHRLSLKITRPGSFNVRMRNGFLGVTDEDSKPALTPAQKVVGALTSPFGAAGVHLQLTSIFSNETKTGSVVRSMLHIDAHDLTFTEQPGGWHQSVFDIVAVTFGVNGQVVDQISRTHTVRIRDEAFRQILRDGLVYAVAVPIKKPGAYQLRTALRDVVSERLGSASQFINVPDLKKDRLALSGIAVSGISVTEYARSNVTPVQSSSGAQTSAPAANQPPIQRTVASQTEGVEEGDAQSGPAVRRFHSGLVMQYGYAIFNAQVNKSTHQPQLTTQVRLILDGKVVFTGQEIPFDASNQTDMKRLVVGGAVQLGTELAPGEYVLQIIVSDTLGKEKYRRTSQWIDFEILK